jgi:hypothetical protein
LLTDDRKKAPLAGDPLELVLATFLESEVRPCDEVFDGRGHEHFAGPGPRRNACADVEREPRKPFIDRLALAGVQPGSQLEPEAPRTLPNRGGAANRPNGTVESGQETASRCFELATAEAVQLGAD